MIEGVEISQWPLWLVVLAILVKMFQAELASLLPKAVQEHFAHRARLLSSRQEHTQELEEVSVEALAQHSVTAQMQLINVNRQLVEFLTTQIDGRLTDIEETLEQVKDLALRGQASDRIVQVEWSRVVEALQRTERLLQSLEAWLHGVEREHAA